MFRLETSIGSKGFACCADHVIFSTRCREVEGDEQKHLPFPGSAVPPLEWDVLIINRPLTTSLPSKLLAA